MKRKEIQELAKKTLPELKEMLREIRQNLLKTKMDLAGGKTKNIRAVAKMRDDLARVATVIRQKELEV